MKQLKRLLRYLLPFKKNIIAILLCNICYAVFSVFSLSMVAPFLTVIFNGGTEITTRPEFSLSMRGVLDTFYYYMGGIIQEHGQLSALIFVAITMVISTLLSNLFRYLGLFANAPIRAGILRGLRKDVYHRLLILPLSFFNKQKKGDIMNRIGSDVQEVEWSIVCSLQMLFRDPILLIVFILTLISISYKLTLLTLLILPPAGWLIAKIGKSIKRNSVEAQQILGRMSSSFDEAISGLRIIKGHTATDYADSRFQKMTDRFYVLNRSIFRKTELGAPLVEFLCIVAIVIVMLIGAKFVMTDSQMTGEVLILFLVIFSRAIPPAQSIISSYYTFQKGMASAERIFQIIDADEVIVEAKDPVRKQSFDDKIEYEHVSFSYHPEEGPEVLSDISFTVKKGENVALVGASGSGKSTIVDLLPRFYDIDSGSIRIDGIDNKKIKISDLRGLMGIVNQDVTLFNDSVFNNIAFGKEGATREDVVTAAKTALAHDFILQMENGYDTMVGDRGMKLSGGQRQRLSIARAVLQNPQILILDEATSALDTESEHLVQQSLQQLMAGRTTIVIAHRLSTIRQADEILFIRDGKIIERGTHDELIAANSAYAKFCALQEM
ncbi:MAG: ABC transporter ATP-binding protein/permease [Bacteroidales bacterium]|nr:ABC transporter ATP-binding protein/permease [Bacteroidales bacterium]